MSKGANDPMTAGEELFAMGCAFVLFCVPVAPLFVLGYAIFFM